MKKLKKIFSNTYFMKIVSYILLAMLLFLVILNKKLGNMDELWNFSSAKNFANGLIPYKDFSVIVTPLSFIFNSIFLKISQTLIMFRIAYFLYYLVIVYLLDKILTILDIKRVLKQFIIGITIIILLNACYLDYNFLQYILVLILILMSLKNPDYQNKKLNILIPIISGLAIVNKQSSGLIVASVNIIIIFLNKIYFKRNISLKYILLQIVLTTVPSIIFIGYLFISGSANDFYDLGILGMTTFSNTIIMPMMVFIILFLYLATFLQLYIHKEKKELWILFFYSLASISFAIPIVDQTHVSFCIVLSFMSLVVAINKNLKKIPQSLIYIFLPIFITLIFININDYITSPKMTKGIYKYIPSFEGEEETINNVDKYILNQSAEYNVYILDFSSALYNLNINKYDKYFEIFMNGNFGIAGKEEMLAILDNGNNKLLINDIDDNWQKPKEIIEHVKKIYHLCGTIESFSIYCK